jgi:hypothetical protein
MTKRRAILVWTLVGLATLITLISSLTVWTKRQLLDTNNWTKTSGKLLADPTVRSTLANRLVDLLYQRVDVAGAIREELPKQAQPAAGTIAAGLQTAAIRGTEAFLATPQAQSAWEQANRRAHGALVDVLEGKKVRNVETANGSLVLDLRPLLQKISDRIGIANKLKANASPTTGEIVLLKSDQLKNAQNAVKIFKALSIFVVIAIFVLYGLAIALARGRRRTVLLVSGSTLLGVGLLLVIVRRVGGNVLVDSVVKVEANRPAVNDIWAIGTTLLRDIAVALIVYGLLAIIAALLAGPSRAAVWTRRTLAPAWRNHAVAVYAVAVLVILIFWAWSPIVQGRRWEGSLVLAALILLGLEMWRRQTLREFPGVPREAVEAAPAAGPTSP